MTMTAVTNAQSYDWKTWTLGIMRSFLSGGAVALTTGTGGALVGVPSKQVWELMGINFVVMGLYRMGEFLQLHGAPDQLTQSLDTAGIAAKQAQVAAGQAVQAVETAKAIAPETKRTEE